MMHNTNDWLDLGPVEQFSGRPLTEVVSGMVRLAVSHRDGVFGAISNVCQHQNGPLGEGKIIYGCITCPWHGYQYQPDTGASPPPFVEKVPTFKVRVQNGRVFVHPQPNPAGTKVEPAVI
jgi:nitrite reductase/ring-hydroxylating ferredoxin subunit